MAPQTRLSKLRQSNPPAAKPAQTNPTATATATTPATPRRRGRPPNKQSTPSKTATSAVKKAAKRGRPPGRRGTKKVPVESQEKPVHSSKNQQQEQSAVPQNEDARPPRTLKPGPKSNRKPPAQPNRRQTGASAQQSPGGRRSPRTNNLTGVSARFRQEESDETVLRYSLSNHSIRTWVQATQPGPPPEDSMAGSKKGNARKAANGENELLRGVLQRNTGKSTVQGGSARNTNSGVTTRSNQVYKEKSYREILEDGTDSVCLIMVPAKDKLSDGGLSKERTALLKDLMHTRGQHALDVRLDPDAYESLLERMHLHNERGIVIELHGVVCPSAGTLRDLSVGDATLRETYDLLVSQWDEPWSQQPNVLPGLSSPQPDYCVGFSKNAFSKHQRAKLSVIAGGKTSFKPTSRMYFPFLSCEVKAPMEGLESAENQNGYSMLIAVRSVIELFRAAKTDFTGSGHIMAFSVSYNHQWVYIHAYYPIVDGRQITIRRRIVYMYCLETVDDPSQSWHFVRNVYERWALGHLERLRKAIDAIDFGVPLPATQAAPVSPAQIDGRVVTAASEAEAMSVDNDGPASASENPGRRAASEEHTEQPSPKKTRR